MQKKYANTSKTETDKSKQPKQAWRPKILCDGSVCQYCGGTVRHGDAICGHCGRSLIRDKCSFCGGLLKPNFKFCTRCEQPREGVICPQCGTLNSRNFCRRCNIPLSPNAAKAFEEAMNDPKFKAIQTRAKELAELHAHIEELNSKSTMGLSDEDRSHLDEYAAILSSLGSVSEQPKKQSDDQTHGIRQVEIKQVESENSDWDFKILSQDELMNAYYEKVDEMNSALAEMAPPPEYTPEQQRDYYAARKIATIETTVDLSGYNSTMWKCNFCGCLHTTPSDCMRPELGGTWLYITPDEYIDKNPQVKKYTGKLNIS